VVRGIEPAVEPAREDEQRDADEASDEVRCLDDAEWKHRLEPREPSGYRRRRAGDEHHDAGAERRDAQRVR
jgi:hypothetical protein